MQITLHDESHRKRAHALIDNAPLMSRVTVADPKRSDEQNDKMWAMISDIMKQLPDWFGPGIDKDDIKQIFVSALFKELRMARNADGDGYIPIVRRSSTLTVGEMSNLISLIEAWGANHGVVWTEPRQDRLLMEREENATAENEGQASLDTERQEVVQPSEEELAAVPRMEPLRSFQVDASSSAIDEPSDQAPPPADLPASGPTGEDFDPIAWAGAFSISLPDYTEAASLETVWKDSFDRRKALAEKSMNLAAGLRNAVHARIAELRR